MCPVGLQVTMEVSACIVFKTQRVKIGSQYFSRSEIGQKCFCGHSTENHKCWSFSSRNISKGSLETWVTDMPLLISKGS